MTWSGLATVAVAAVLLTGCLANDGAPGGDAAPPAADLAAGHTRYLTPDGALSAAPAEPGAVPAGDFVLRWTSGQGEHPHFPGSTDAVRVAADAVAIELWLETDLPVLPARGALPDVAVWFGGDGHLPLVASADLETPLLPGEPVRVAFTPVGPERQPDLVVRDRLELLVAVTMTQLEAHNVRILTGPDHPSRVLYQAAPMGPAAAAPELETQDFAGMLPLPDRVVGPLPGETNHHDILVRVPASASLLLVEVAATGGGHTVDMDIQLLDREGQVITWGVTPYAAETLRLEGDGLMRYRDTDLTLRVANHLGAVMEYAGTIATG